MARETAAPDLGNEDCDPAFRYSLFHMYDWGSYEDDLARFPDFFDENGWPLFGDCDPYALSHPLTGRPWYEAPRIPTPLEADADYKWWFAIAEQFNNAEAELLGSMKAVKGLRVSDPKTSDCVYKSKAKGAFRGNLAFLNAEVRPRLKALLAERRSPLELSQLLAEYLRLVERLRHSATATRHRVNRGARDDRAPQAKWYLQFCAFCEEAGLSKNATNKIFISIAKPIALGKKPPPNGFDKSFFERAVGREEVEGTNKPIGGLPETLKRVSRRPDVDELRLADPDADPAIPPVDPACYGESIGVHKGHKPLK